MLALRDDGEHWAIQPFADALDAARLAVLRARATYGSRSFFPASLCFLEIDRDEWQEWQERLTRHVTRRNIRETKLN